jgi:hypothetical protein
MNHSLLVCCHVEPIKKKELNQTKLVHFTSEKYNRRNLSKNDGTFLKTTEPF